MGLQSILSQPRVFVGRLDCSQESDTLAQKLLERVVSLFLLEERGGHAILLSVDGILTWHAWRCAVQGIA